MTLTGDQDKGNFPSLQAAMAALCPVHDVPCLRALSYALKNAVLSVADNYDCGLASNWAPIMQLVIHPLFTTEFEFFYMVNELAKRTLPETMQQMPPMKLLLNALDPAGELSIYDDDADNLKQILQANDSELVNVITQISNEAEASGFSMAAEVQQLLTRITEFLAGKVFVKKESKKEVKEEVKKEEELKKIDGKYPRPRGAAPKGKNWDYNNGGWVTEDDGDGTTSPVTKKKEQPKWTRPRGAAPLSDKGEKQEWDHEIGWWVVCSEQPPKQSPKKRKAECDELQSDKVLKTDTAEDKSRVEELDDAEEPPKAEQEEKTEAPPKEKTEALPMEEEKTEALPKEEEKTEALPKEEEKTEALPKEKTEEPPKEKTEALPMEEEKTEALPKAELPKEEKTEETIEHVD